jgi:WD40 repeat protein/serine/threonine protein kinase/tetratricopeptide (TPR) repeat protein
MSTPSSADPIGEIADQFVEAFRQGKHPSVEDYAARYPEHANELREILPALVLMEKVKSEDEASASQPSEGPASVPPLRQLGDYQILREIGRGGMGVVYEATQISLGRHVAVKVLPSHALLDPRHLGRFQREARSAAKLHHTNIVPVFGVGEQDGLHYYVMQFIQGLGLDEVLVELRRLRRPNDPGLLTLSQSPQVRTEGASAVHVARSLLTGSHATAAPAELPPTQSSLLPLGDVPSGGVPHSDSSIHLPGQSEASSLSESGRQFWQSVARVGIQVASALEYASSQGVLHRDIKPSNLLLDAQGNVWVTDFGLAKGMADTDDLTHTGDVIGTLRYMAPERFSGQGDLRSDLYSLGLTLYELLALRPAFDETDRNKLIRRVMHDEPVRPRKLIPAVPRDLETVVLKAIDRDPARRYQAAAEMIDDLKRFLEDRPVRARRASEMEKLLRWCRRNPMPATLLAALVMVFLLGFGGVFWQWRGAEAARKDEIHQRNRAETLRQAAEESRTAAESAREQAEVTLYHSTIARARLEQQANNTLGAETILNGCPPGRRGWEWHFLKGLSHSDLFTLKGHTGWVFSVAVSPDGRLIATAGGGNPYWNTQAPEATQPGEVILWDAATGEQIRTIRGHGNVVTCVVFSPDGTRLATSGPDPDGVPRLWDVATGRELRRFKRRMTALDVIPAMRGGHIAWSPDGQRLAIGAANGNEVSICDVNGDRELTILPRPSPTVGDPQRSYPIIGTTQVLFSPDGRRLVCKHMFDYIGSGIRIWDATTGKELPPLERNSVTSTGLAISPDGNFLAAADLPSTIKLWDLRTGRIKNTLFGHQDMINGLAFSPDSRLLASGSDDCTVRVWDVDHGHEVRRYRGHLAKVLSVAFSPGGERLVSGGADHTVKVWDVTYHPEYGQLVSHTFHGYNAGLAFSADDRRLVMIQHSAPAVIMSIEPTTGTVLDRRPVVPLSCRFAVPAQSTSLDQNARWLAGVSLADRKVAGCYDVATGREHVQLRGHTQAIWHVSMSDEGQRIATGSSIRSHADAPGEVKVWDAETGKPLLEVSDKGLGILRIALSASGDRLAVAGRYKGLDDDDAPTILRVYSVASGEQSHEAAVEKDAILGLTFDRNANRLIAVGARGTVLLWDLATGQRTISNQGPHMAQDVAVSPDGRRLAVASRTETKLLDANTGEEILVLRNEKQTPGNTNAYNPRVRWSHDGRLLAVNCDGILTSVCVWSIWANDTEARAVRRRAAERRAVIGHTETMRLGLYPFGQDGRKLDLDRIRDLELGSAWEYADRALGFFSFHDEARAKADLARATALAPDAGIAYCVCGRHLYEQGQLKKARDYFALGLEAIGGKFEDLRIPVTLFAYLDDGELYRRYAKECWINYFDGPNAFNGSLGAFNAPVLFRPDSGVDPRELLEDSQKQSTAPATRDSWPHWRHGLTLFRAGQFQAALDSFDKERAQKKPKSEPCLPELLQILRALALARLNQIDAARAALAEADELLKSKPIKEGDPVPGGYLRLATEVLRREAAESIRGPSGANPR